MLLVSLQVGLFKQPSWTRVKIVAFLTCKSKNHSGLYEIRDYFRYLYFFSFDLFKNISLTTKECF